MRSPAVTNQEHVISSETGVAPVSASGAEGQPVTPGEPPSRQRNFLYSISIRGLMTAGCQILIGMFVIWHLFFLLWRNPLDLWEEKIKTLAKKQGWWEKV